MINVLGIFVQVPLYKIRNIILDSCPEAIWALSPLQGALLLLNWPLTGHKLKYFFVENYVWGSIWKTVLVQEIWDSQQGIKGKQIIKEWLNPTAIPMQSSKWDITTNSLCHMAHMQAVGLEFKLDEFWSLLTPKFFGNFCEDFRQTAL